MGLLDFTPLGEYARNVDRGLIIVLVMLMSELSQAERTACEAAWDSWRPEAVPSRREVHAHAFNAGRDYGRERERALEKALRRIVGNIERDGYASPALAAIAEVASSALAASPGEPEGQQGFTDEDLEIDTLTQPDHGPGEPSEHPTWNLFCPECEQTSVDMGDGSCETCGAQTISVVQEGESNG